MLTFIIDKKEIWDSEKEEFRYTDGYELSFEYTLKVVAEWESKWRKSWFSKAVPKEPEEVIDMFRLMCTDKEVFDERLLSVKVQQELLTYINDTRTATTFSHLEQNSSSTIITTEVLYASMFMNGVPIECENWHLGRLITLLQVIAEKSNPKRKMSKVDELAQRRMLNAERRAKLKSKG